MGSLFIEIKYHVERENPFEFTSNIKEELRSDILEAVMSTHIGAGSDSRERIDRDVYVIRIDWDLSDDSYKLTSNTNNSGLDTGILMAAMGILNEAI
jgi:hypothetical protein